MMERFKNGDETAGRMPEARYSYYRRCQVFRRNGEQCKAPAETGALICHAHAGQLAMAVRRERERRAVLEEAVAEMRRRGRPEFEAKDLFMDFRGIQVSLAVMAQALINGRIDCKTAGRLVVQLQTASKLLWLYHRGHRGSQRTATVLTTKDTKEQKALPQVCADGRRLDKPGEKAHLTTEAQRHGEGPNAEKTCAANHLITNHGEEIRIGLLAKVAAFADIRGRSHGPPGWARAA